MKITEIKATIVEGSYPWVYFRVLTDEGLYGLAEAYPVRGVIDVVARQLEEFLIGQDPLAIEPLYNYLLERTPGQSTGGTTLAAISAIEVALWDIKGKALGIPVYQLLGGAYRDRVRLYADVGHGTHMEDTTQAWADRAREGRDDGFAAIKFDIDPLPSQRDEYNRGIRNDHIQYYIDVVTAMREALKPDTDLAIDAHWAYTVVDILKVAQAFEDLNLLWLEDPIPAENIEAMQRVKNSTRTPICTGENFYTRHGFRELIHSQAADIVSPDIAKAGGVLESKRIAEMADMYYMPLAPHNICGPIGTYAMMHVCAAVPNFLALEFHHLDNQFWSDLIVEGPMIVDGHIEVPEKPGLGVTLNEDVVKQGMRESLGFFD